MIQSAAPDGINGAINNTAPELNITSALASIDTPDLNLDRVGQNPCSLAARHNTLKSVGYGAVTSFKKGQNQQTLEPLLNTSTEDKTEASVVPESPDQAKALDEKHKQFPATQVAAILITSTEHTKPPVTTSLDCQKRNYLL